MNASSLQERATLDRVLVWGEIPATDTAVERAERAREHDIAKHTNDDEAGA